VWLSLEAEWNPFNSLTAAVEFDISGQTGDGGRECPQKEVVGQSWVRKAHGLRKCVVGVL